MADGIEERCENLLDVVSDTLEALAFMEVVPSEIEEIEEPGPETIWAEIEVLQPAPGRLIIFAPAQLAVEIVETMLGPSDEDAPPPEGSLRDVLAELANTIAGRMMNQIMTPDQTLELSLPVTGLGGCIPRKALVCPMTAEDHEFLVVAEGVLVPQEKD